MPARCSPVKQKSSGLRATTEPVAAVNCVSGQCFVRTNPFSLRMPVEVQQRVSIVLSSQLAINSQRVKITKSVCRACLGCHARQQTRRLIYISRKIEDAIGRAALDSSDPRVVDATRMGHGKLRQENHGGTAFGKRSLARPFGPADGAS